ncbi:hypothetical protein P692DRAFT_201724192 [Suillus brevipes Sb2]|nr:hypothetical protein P692DRAFT_201724192 [Suillus brevipes Sb2]
MERLPGILLLDSLDWNPDSVDDVVTIYIDASLTRIAYWFPGLNFGFQCHLSLAEPTETIFFFEALTVCSNIHALADTEPIPRHVAIFTDNSNTVDIFNSLRALAPYNRILMSAVHVLIELNDDLRVYHVPGAENFVADALSRFNNDQALWHLVPDLIIDTFTPPRDVLGAAEK